MTSGTTQVPLVSVRGLRKRFRLRTILQNINLDLFPGTVTAIVGPNGAGKTTLNKVLLGLSRPDAGTIHFDGRDTADDIGYRARIGYMPQTPRFPEAFTVGDVLQLLRDLRSESGPRDEELVEVFALTPLFDQLTRTLSGGQRQRLNAAAAFLFKPDLLLLDEPTAGLDPVASGLLKDKIRALRATRRAVVITSHILSELQALADTVVFLHEGRIEWQGPLGGLMRETGAESLEGAIALLMIERAKINRPDGANR